MTGNLLEVPAFAGMAGNLPEVPAFAGMTGNLLEIPAFAGMTRYAGMTFPTEVAVLP